MLDLHLESHVVDAGVNGHKVISSAKRHLVNCSIPEAGANWILKSASSLPAARPLWRSACVSALYFRIFIFYTGSFTDV